MVKYMYKFVQYNLSDNLHNIFYLKSDVHSKIIF